MGRRMWHQTLPPTWHRSKQLKMFKTGRPCHMLSVGRFQELSEAAKELMATFSWDAVQVEKQNLFQVRTMRIPDVQNSRKWVQTFSVKTAARCGKWIQGKSRFCWKRKLSSATWRDYYVMPADVPIILALIKQDRYHTFQASLGYSDRNSVSRKEEW